MRKEDSEREEEVKTGEKPENTKCEGVSEVIPGQMDLEKDFSEYCPEDTGNKPEEEQVAAGCPYETRLEYLKTLSAEDHARYMADIMRTRFVGLSFRQLTEEDFWKRWLMCIVDESGRTIEEG